MNKTLACTLSLLFLTPVLLGAQSGADTLASDPRVATVLELIELWMDAQVDYEDIPGVTMGIVHDQDLIWSKGFGYSHVESETPAAPDTIYSICSISKLFTSISLMQLRDEGLLRLDDPIADHLPWFTIQDSHPETGAIDLQGVLTHSAGLPRESDHPYWTGPDYPFPTRDQIIDSLLAGEETHAVFE